MSQNLPESEAESLSFIKESLIYMILCSIWNTFRESTAYALVNRFCAWLDRIVSNSMLFHWVTGQNSAQSLKSRVFTRLHAWLNRLFHALRLDKLLCGSIFTKPLLWGALAMLLAPVVPTIVVLALVLASFLSALCIFGIQPDRQLVYSPVNKWMYLYAAIYLFATVTSISVRGSLYVGALTVFFLLFYTVLTTFVTKWSQLKNLLIGMTAVGVLVSLYGFWQYLHPMSQSSHAWVDEDMFSSISVRVYATLDNPNVLGTYFLLLIPFCAALFLQAATKWKKFCYAMACIIMVSCLILTYSRGCYLGLIIAVAVFLVLLDRKFLILGIVLLLFSPLILPDTIVNRFMSIGDMSDSSTSYRVSIWMGVLSMLKQYWISGIGPGQEAFNQIYALYSYGAAVAQHAHNLFLQILCDAGIVGLVGFFGIMISTLRLCCTALKREYHRDAQLFQIAAIAAIFGFLVESMTDYSFYNYRVMFLFWGIIAISVLVCRSQELKQADLNGQKLWKSETRHAETRVLHICSDTNIGGAGRCLLNYLKYYDQSQYDVCVILPKGSMLKPAVEALDTLVFEMDIRGDVSLDWKAVLQLRAVIAAAEPDIVHTHGNMSGRIAARCCQAKLIYTRHSAFPIPESQKHGVKHEIIRLVNSLYFDRVIAVGESVKENLLDLGVQPEQIDVMLNGVEPVQRTSEEVQTQWRERCDIHRGAFVIGILARIEEYKGHQFLLEAAAKLKAEGCPIKILIAGTGDFETELRQKTNELDLQDCVTYLGFVNQIDAFLSVLDVQVNCSYLSETSSLSLLEGFSMGLPAVVSRCGGNPWLVDDGKNGLVFENKNSDDLARCLRLLIDDQTLLPAMRKGAREIYEERFTGQIFARNIETVYQRVLEK